MPKLPNAPDLNHLRAIGPALRTLDTRKLWHRVYRRGGEHPTRWDALRFHGPASARFDHHVLDDTGKAKLQGRGILYLASDVPTCLAEVYQENREVDTNDRHPWLVSFRLASTLTVLDLTETFAVRAGCSMKLVSGPRPHAQNGARGFYDVYSNIDGLYFLSSMTNRPAAALFERALDRNPFPASPDFHRSLSDPLLHIPIQEACKDIDYRYSPAIRF